MWHFVENIIIIIVRSDSFLYCRDNEGLAYLQIILFNQYRNERTVIIVVISLLLLTQYIVPAVVIIMLSCCFVFFFFIYSYFFHIFSYSHLATCVFNKYSV